ncbi:S8 family serine peptidase [Luteolibacter soli]|uniref:S8 family serine peptidase n=1 Tax=Luteolibacter soli TaxID=3135280 RepID=A0ABU9AR12_9BACT
MKKPLRLGLVLASSLLLFILLRRETDDATQAKPSLPTKVTAIRPEKKTNGTTPPADEKVADAPAGEVMEEPAPPLPAPPPAPGLIPLQNPPAKQFDPRFVQPATRMGLFGVRDEATLRQIAEQDAAASADKAAAIAWAKANGWPVKGKKQDGGDFELMRLNEQGLPAYYETDNSNARISHNVEPLTQFGGPPGGVTINLSGYTWLAGMWESGPPRLSHQEFNDFPGRVVYAETGSTGDVLFAPTTHATHVMGTILGNGFVDDHARGMAWRASAKCYGWNSDDFEMRGYCATATNQPSKLYVSNHSYGVPTGWLQYPKDHATRANLYYWGGSNGAAEAAQFGKYSNSCRERDITCRVTPYHLPFFAAGNERGDKPPNGATIYFFVPNGSGGYVETSGTWPNASAPAVDGSVDGGYDTLPDNGNAKNVMAVGSMLDAVSNGSRSTSVGMSSFSSYGPTDDGRIKPDIVANGQDVLSASDASDTATATLSGTSMATPGATGTALLMHEHYRDMTGQYLRASTLKALMIHTATDVQAPGPDYASGWGLIDAWAGANHIDLHASEPGGYHIVEGVLSQNSREFRVTFTATGLIKATLAWTDPEGTAQSGLDNRTKVLVNDLDLTLRAPDGTIYRSPELDPTNPTAAPVYNGNTRDNVEMIGGFPLQLIPGLPGTYELSVTYKGSLTEPDPLEPTNLKQAFSLMLQGNVANTSGTIAEAIDKPDRSFTKQAAATASFAWQSSGGATGGDRAVNLAIGNSQSAGFETVVTGPVTVSFDWGVSSEATYDFLRFYSDGVKQQEISGSVATTSISYNVPAGTHTLRWAYEKDGSQTAGSDQGWIDNLEFNSLPEAMDNLPYTFTEPTGSAAPWSLLNASSVPTGDVAKSAEINAGQRSDMETIIQGPALVRFRMVQTAANGELRAQWGPNLSRSILHGAGNVWKTYSIELDSGPQTVRWSWYKPITQAGNGYADELVVIPLPSSLRDAADLPVNASNLVVENYADAPWQSDASDAAPSGRGGERGTSSIHTVYTAGANNDTAIRFPIISNGGGTVSFWWQASGSVGGNLSLQIRTTTNGSFVQAGPSVGPRKITAIPGGTPWQQVHIEIPPGYAELRFLYTASGTAGQGWIDQIEFQEGIMHPARGLDRWGSRWETYGDAPWGAINDTTNGGIDSTSHSPIGNNQSTSLTTTVTGPKKLFFHWKVDSETNYDFLRFEMDGENAAAPISGQNGGWRPVVVNIPAGTHSLRWFYQKDSSQSIGQDRGWIDKVCILRPDFGVSNPRPDPNGAYVIVPMRKDPTAGFFLERSTDLIHWEFTGYNGMIDPRFTDVNVIVSHTGVKTFYRARFEPEMIQTIENAGFELPAASPNTFWNDAPGWGPDGDAFTATSFENIPNFAAGGAQHLSIAAGSFSEMKGTFLGYRGVHSITAAIGNRSGFTQPGNLSSVVLISGAELSRMAVGAAAIPAGNWSRSMPASFDSFETNLDAAYSYKVRLESTGNRSFFDDVQVVTEPQ